MAVGYTVDSYPQYSHVDLRCVMKTIQMTIDDDLLAAVDQLTTSLQTTRSAFIRSALQLALRHHAILEQERQHAQGYARHPVMPGEFDLWAAEQNWGAE